MYSAAASSKVRIHLESGRVYSNGQWNRQIKVIRLIVCIVHSLGVVGESVAERTKTTPERNTNNHLACVCVCARVCPCVHMYVY